MLLGELVNILNKVRKTHSRDEKVVIVADFLRNLDEDDLRDVIKLISGNIGKLNISWGTIAKAVGLSHGEDIGEMVERSLSGKKRQQSLVEEAVTVKELMNLFAYLRTLKGKGSAERKIALIQSLFRRLSPEEANFVARCITGEMRMGLSTGLLIEAIARAFGKGDLRKAYTVVGDISELALMAKRGILQVSPRLFFPISPMLAESCYSVDDAIKEMGIAAFEYKLDGVRVQVHKDGGRIKMFSRRLTDITDRFRVELDLKCESCIAEGEIIGLGLDGRPVPFQVLMRKADIKKEILFFDIIYLDGRNLLDIPYQERRKMLEEVSDKLVPRIITDDPRKAEEFLKEAVEEGHEGLMAKKLNSPYQAGIRGRYWLKIKPGLEKLDLVIVGADWGYGRRNRWLSDYYLAAYNEEKGDFEIVGKTFKGLTDEEFERMTSWLSSIAVKEEGKTVWVKPEVVVEVAYDEIQRSPKYKSGFALRFARITAIREDKSPRDADTISKIRRIYEAQFSRKSAKW
ncbi:MAG: ATP-dependent DNA ligase [Candidatus Methanodesulfokora sp.]|jgi:DNA ligase-1